MLKFISDDEKIKRAKEKRQRKADKAKKIRERKFWKKLKALHFIENKDEAVILCHPKALKILLIVLKKTKPKSKQYME